MPLISQDSAPLASQPGPQMARQEGAWLPLAEARLLFSVLCTVASRISGHGPASIRDGSIGWVQKRAASQSAPHDHETQHDHFVSNAREQSWAPL